MWPGGGTNERDVARTPCVGTAATGLATAGALGTDIGFTPGFDDSGDGPVAPGTWATRLPLATGVKFEAGSTPGWPPCEGP